EEVEAEQVDDSREAALRPREHRDSEDERDDPGHRAEPALADGLGARGQRSHFGEPEHHGRGADGVQESELRDRGPHEHDRARAPATMSRSARLVGSGCRANSRSSATAETTKATPTTIPTVLTVGAASARIETPTAIATVPCATSGSPPIRLCQIERPGRRRS